MKKMPKHIRNLLDEWDVLIENHKQALLADDLETARKCSDELWLFTERHHETLNIPAEQVSDIRQSKKEVDVSYKEHEILETRLENVRRTREQLTQKYQEMLLEIPPEGKDRTAH